jgi:hypothetical protein
MKTLKFIGRFDVSTLRITFSVLEFMFETPLNHVPKVWSQTIGESKGGTYKKERNLREK